MDQRTRERERRESKIDGRRTVYMCTIHIYLYIYVDRKACRGKYQDELRETRPRPVVDLSSLKEGNEGSRNGPSINISVK